MPDTPPIPRRPAMTPMRLMLQLEGAAVAALALAAYASTGESWAVFALFFLAPDLAMLGYRAGNRAGVACYNAAHSYAGPCAMACLALAGAGWAWPAALIWAAHIGIDRAIGYGLKYPSHFRDTHLARL